MRFRDIILEGDFFIGQTKFDVVLDSLIYDLERVKKYAVNKYTLETANTGRFTRAAIYAMLADMYLWKGDWDKVIENCEWVTERKLFEYKEKLEMLGLGLENRMTTKVGLLSGGQRQALTLLMATVQRPKLLLLDEHTAALDPATAAKVLELSDKLIADNELTAMMITHNMTDAIKHGTRLIMMHEGRIILDVEGEEKKRLTKADLMEKFAELAGSQLESDEILLT